MVRKRYEVGTSMHIYPFDCMECAFRFYRELKKEVKNVYLMDTKKNIILANTYGWKNGEFEDED